MYFTQLPENIVSGIFQEFRDVGAAYDALDSPVMIIPCYILLIREILDARCLIPI